MIEGQLHVDYEQNGHDEKDYVSMRIINYKQYNDRRATR